MINSILDSVLGILNDFFGIPDQFPCFLLYSASKVLNSAFDLISIHGGVTQKWTNFFASGPVDRSMSKGN